VFVSTAARLTTLTHSNEWTATSVAPNTVSAETNLRLTMTEHTTIRATTATVPKEYIPSHSTDGRAYANAVDWLEEHHDVKVWTIDDTGGITIHCVPSSEHVDAEKAAQAAIHLLCSGYFRPSEHTTIRVTVDAKETADRAKHENETWNEYIQRCTENSPEIIEFVEADHSGIDYTELANQVGDEVERRLR
jgi:hypothetical protein